LSLSGISVQCDGIQNLQLPIRQLETQQTHLTADSCSEVAPSCSDLCVAFSDPQLLDEYRIKYSVKYWVKNRVAEVVGPGQRWAPLETLNRDQLKSTAVEVMRKMDLQADIARGNERLVWQYVVKYVYKAASKS
jgi:hypothetical protein